MAMILAYALALVAAAGPGDLEQRVAAVMPTAAEERWTSIPWRLDLDEARKDSADTGKPLFLWIMNGHPFGCT